MSARLEHVNINVADGAGFAALLEAVFGWTTRWEGLLEDGQRYARHVGGADSYVAIFEPAGEVVEGGIFNHFGIVVEDLDAVQARVEAFGLRPHHHADYEPGRRFYFMAPQGIEIEVIAYA